MGGGGVRAATPKFREWDKSTSLAGLLRLITVITLWRFVSGPLLRALSKFESKVTWVAGKLDSVDSASITSIAATEYSSAPCL